MERYISVFDNFCSVDINEYVLVIDMLFLGIDDWWLVVDNEIYVDLNNMYVYFDNVGYVE